MVNYSLLQTAAFAFLGDNKSIRYSPAGGVHNNVDRQSSCTPLQSHSTVVSPLYIPPQLTPGVELGFLSELPYSPLHTDDTDTTTDSIDDLAYLLDAETNKNLRLETTTDGVRGLYVNSEIKEGQAILRIPLANCLRDDEPPQWMIKKEKESASPSQSLTRLAARVVDLKLNEHSIDEGSAKWLSMLPDSTFLRASLPVHWSEDTLRGASSTALEVAVDEAYFERKAALAELLQGLENCPQATNIPMAQLQKLCEEALDIVQTRACRVQLPAQYDIRMMVDTSPMRIVAPIFDFINHGSANFRGEGSANADFGLENRDNPYLVVRAMKDMEAGEEVLVDYGYLARPAWNCLLSYGFVPQYKTTIPSLVNDDDDEDDDEDYEDYQEDYDDENIAEVFMDGVRYEVGPSSIPMDMVVAASSSMVAESLMSNVKNSEEFASARGALLQEDFAAGEDEEAILSPDVASRISKRISAVAYQLLLDPEFDSTNKFGDDDIVPPEEIISSQLAASLRWAHHRILLACALGISEYSNDDSD